MRTNGTLALALLATAPLGATPPDTRTQPSRDAVVATVGTKTIGQQELLARMEGIPSFQLAAFASTPDGIKRKLVEDVLVPEVLYELEAERRGLSEGATRYQTRRVLAGGTLRAIREQAGSAESIPESDVLRYYEEHKSTFVAPERVQIWRILCDQKEDCELVLGKLKKDPSAKNFTDLAREHSTDKGTYLRGGNLGYIDPSGKSNMGSLQVDPALFQAASQVKDNEVVPRVVREGERFAVLMRRSVIPASSRSLAEASQQIRDTLHRQKLDAHERAFVSALRARVVKLGDESALADLALPLPDPRLPPSAKSRTSGPP